MIKTIIGSVMLILPFIWFGILMYKDGGWKEVLFVYGGTFIMSAFILTGIFLITGGL